MTPMEMAIEFHEKFGVDLHQRRYTGPKFIEEENHELAAAIAANDQVQILDALCDIQVFLDGTFHAWGLDKVKQAAMEEVHRSNMSKLGEDGKPIKRADGKVIKGPKYSPPRLEQFIT